MIREKDRRKDDWLAKSGRCQNDYNAVKMIANAFEEDGVLGTRYWVLPHSVQNEVSCVSLRHGLRHPIRLGSIRLSAMSGPQLPAG